MLDISQILITSQTETTEKINREEMTIDNTIQDMKRSLEFSVIISNYEKAKKKTSDRFFSATKRRFMMYQDISSTSLFKKTSFASDMMKAIFQDNNFYLKTIIKIDEQIQSCRFHCDCSMIENEIFSKKVMMYSSKKKSSESTK